MKLTEILNKKVDYDVVRATAERFITMAQVGDRHIKFSATNCGNDLWDIMFTETDEHGKNGTFKATGSGNELEVFAMVRDSMKELIDRYSPQTMKFTASKEGGKDNRANAYENLIKRFKLTGYTMKRESDDKISSDEFTLTKND